jgi:hypothetical protein
MGYSRKVEGTSFPMVVVEPNGPQNKEKFAFENGLF